MRVWVKGRVGEPAGGCVGERAGLCGGSIPSLWGAGRVLSERCESKTSGA